MFESKSGGGAFLLPELATPAAVLKNCFRANRGACIGQSTVVSQKVHTFQPNQPEIVTVIENSDAGQVFYQRRQAGDVYHLDIFHECGQLEHELVSRALRRAVEVYNYHDSLGAVDLFSVKGGLSDCGVSADLIDVQTGTGGGRITGSLTYGRKLSLRRVHSNHVHVAVMLPDEHLACLFYLVMAVEEVVLGAGLELRRNEGIEHGRGGAGADISPYADNTDSFLRQKDAAMPEPVRRQQYRQDMADLAEDFDSVQDIREVLTEVAQENCERKVNQAVQRRGGGEQGLRRLADLGLVALKDGKVALTEYGREFLAYLGKHLPDLEAYLRRSFRLLKPPLGKMRRGGKLATEAGSGGGGRRLLRPCRPDGRRGELAVAETVSAAARRAVAENLPALRITPADFHEYVRRKRPRTEICLLVDASESMTGQRIRAAKFLARHLLTANPDRLSIITFQGENTVKVALPFTRDWHQGEESLKQIASSGSTPLASGLKGCINYLSAAGIRRPLIILITDGVPTAASDSRDPMADALAAAAEIKRRGYGFACIGLKPHRKFLLELAEQAGGSVYMLAELEKRALVKTAWHDCVARYL